VRRYTWGANWYGSTSSVEKEGCAMLKRCSLSSTGFAGQACLQLSDSNVTSWKINYMQCFFIFTERGTFGSCLSFLDIRI
jgi:hypothetical protein